MTSARMLAVPALAAGLLLGQSSMAWAEVDLTTGAEAVDYPVTPLPPANEGAIEVLWDLTHGVYLDYEPTGAYADLVALLSANGYNVGTTTLGVDNLDLSAWDILVVNVGSAYNSAYTASEVAAIQDFVTDGGALLIMGDNPFVWNSNINPVSEAYGTTCGIVDQGGVTDFISHPIFSGVSVISFVAGGSLQVGAPSIEAAFDASGRCGVSLVEECQVITVGDVNFCAEGLGSDDNTAFVLNVFGCLALNGPVPVLETTWGGIKSTYR